MPKIRNTATVSFESTITLGEREMKALEGLTVYGVKPFLEGYKKHLGSAYMDEEGLALLFAAIQEQVSPALADAHQARRDLNEAFRKRQIQNEERWAEVRKKNAEEETKRENAKFEARLEEREKLKKKRERLDKAPAKKAKK